MKKIRKNLTISKTAVKLKEKGGKNMCRAVSYNADACCRKLYSSYSSANTPKRAKISLKESHVMIRALQVKIARKEDKKYSLDEKVVLFIGFEEAEFVKSLKRSKIDKKIVLEARKKSTKNEEDRKSVV